MGSLILLLLSCLFEFFLYIDDMLIMLSSWLLVGLMLSIKSNRIWCISYDESLTRPVNQQVSESIPVVNSDATVDITDSNQVEHSRDDVIQNHSTPNDDCSCTSEAESLASTSSTNTGMSEATPSRVVVNIVNEYITTHSMINNGGNFHAVQGLSGRMTCVSRSADVSDDEHVADCTFDDQDTVTKPTEDISTCKVPRDVLRVALLLALSDDGLSRNLLHVASRIICKGLCIASHLLENESSAVFDLINDLQSYEMIRENREHTPIKLSASALELIRSNSLDTRGEDRHLASLTFCNILFHVLELRSHSVCSLHREVVLLTQRYLAAKPSTRCLTPVKTGQLYVALGKRMGKVGTLKDAFNYIDKGCCWYKDCLKNTECDANHSEIKQWLVDALVAKGKMKRRRGGTYLLTSLDCFKQAEHKQTEIDGSSEMGTLSKYKARILVAQCETYLSLCKYSKIVSVLDDTNVEEAVLLDSSYHQAQYFANLGCAFDFLGDHERAHKLLLQAVKVSTNDQCNYRRPLYFSIHSRVLVHLWHKSHDESYLKDAQDLSCKAEEMLVGDHGKEHRFFALNKRCMAMVCFAAATCSSHIGPLQRIAMSTALAHATDALKVYLHVYSDTRHHPNIAFTWKLIEAMCIYISGFQSQIMFDVCRCQLKELYQMSINEQEHHTLSDAIHYAQHFEKCASTVLEQCNCSLEHPYIWR
ncbi:uncharacterized protein LOC134190435 [Corticium candelabrum]|uniref:uncharacterized protein LOC134190435 n=1 Tax=Corticium candelabrum TaxID=121492 RepID=UPI002E2612B2|nr:uncharacterized protein LOC134190435 [Corticium candelabrum]XP_062514872.1 uncharacterized protein LOC134190435 [Corticium candelabrum]XP_062514873.1 uncharacterized protein LOC134190435 [Corticium candelabrum]